MSCAKDLAKGQIISYDILKRSLGKSSPPDTIYDAFVAVGRPARHPLVAGRLLKFSDCFSEGEAFTSSRGRRSVDCTGRRATKSLKQGHKIEYGDVIPGWMKLFYGR